MMESEEAEGVSYHDVIAVKLVDKVTNSEDIVKDAEALHRMLGEAKQKVELGVTGIEAFIERISGEEKF